MKQYIVGFSLLMTGTILGILASPILPTQSNSTGYSTNMILRTDLQNIPGQEVLIFASEWKPGAALPLHFHPDGHEFVYVVEGEQTFHFQEGGTKTVKAGEALYTPPNVAHFGENPTDKLSKVVVFRIKDKTQPMSIEVSK